MMRKIDRTTGEALIVMCSISKAMSWCMADENWMIVEKLYSDLRRLDPWLISPKLAGCPFEASAMDIEYHWQLITAEWERSRLASERDRKA